MTTLTPFYQTIGQGPNLVLLHGWGTHGGIFELIAPELSQHFTVTLVDLPGFGRSPLPNDEYTLELLTEQVKSIFPDKAHLLGWSLGGLVATHLASQIPERVESLITVGSSPQFLESNDWPFAMKTSVMENFVSLLIEDYETTLIRFLLIQTLGSPSQKQDIALLKDTVFLHGKPAPRALKGGLEILQDNNLRTSLANLKIPLLRVYGRLDSLVPYKAIQEIDKIHPESETHTFDKASHAPFISHPKEFNQRVLAFLQSIGRA